MLGARLAGPAAKKSTLSALVPLDFIRSKRRHEMGVACSGTDAHASAAGIGGRPAVAFASPITLGRLASYWTRLWRLLRRTRSKLRRIGGVDSG